MFCSMGCAGNCYAILQVSVHGVGVVVPYPELISCSEWHLIYCSGSLHCWYKCCAIRVVNGVEETHNSFEY